jgi:uncharacterized protein with beta-barrel porin domain
MKKTNLKKIALFSVALLASLPAYSISGGGIAAATIGSVAGATIIGVAISKSHKKKKEKEESSSASSSKKHKNGYSKSSTSSTQSKKAMKKDLKEYKNQLATHKADLQRAERKQKKHKSKSADADVMKHKAEIAKLEPMVKDLEERIKKAS